MMRLAFSWVVFLAWLASADGAVQIFFDDFDGGQFTNCGETTGVWSGITDTESVEGYAGIGNGDNVFDGNFLHNRTGRKAGGVPQATTLTVSGLPMHSSIDLDFLLAIVNSWDGNTHPDYAIHVPDYFRVYIDGDLLFSETFDFESADDQTYIPPPGGLLREYDALPRDISGDNFGVGTFPDTAYDMSVEPAFSDIPHTSSTLQVQFMAGGHGWDGFRDESWALDNVSVSIDREALPGDANLDGIVDLLDFNIWNAHKFTTGTDWTTGNFNGDCLTDLSDFNIWNAHKFTVAEGGAAPAPTEVPEPGVPVMLLIAATIALVARKRR